MGNSGTTDNKKGECVNCIVCKEGSEFCPKSDNYDPDAYLKIEEMLQSRKRQKADRKPHKA